jgi:hypothetical protein
VQIFALPYIQVYTGKKKTLQALSGLAFSSAKKILILRLPRVCVCAKIVPNFWSGRPEFIDTDVLFANIVFTPKKEEVMEGKGSAFSAYTTFSYAKAAHTLL